MRIMWICSFPPALVAEKEGMRKNQFGGWIDGALSKLLSGNNLIAVCYPRFEKNGSWTGNAGRLVYYGIHLSRQDYGYEEAAVEQYRKAINEFSPDVIHIWGVEFPFFYAAIQASENKHKIVCSIQGLCGIISNHYYSHMPYAVYKNKTIRDIIKNDSIVKQKKMFAKRGIYEKKILKAVYHVIGRTEWDKACMNIFAPQAQYHLCNETLRDAFYQKNQSWSYNECEIHSIFVSQYNYPIKGFHILLNAANIILKKYNDIKIYTTGVSPYQIRRYRRSAYHNYLISLMDEYGLQDRTIFLGTLSAEEMKERFLLSNVFVSSSSIENSPNSVGEAMILGVPTVASYVGGTMDLLKHEKEGFLYQADADYMLAHYIMRIFEMKEKAEIMGENAKSHAQLTHDPIVNFTKLMSIYTEIVQQVNK